MSLDKSAERTSCLFQELQDAIERSFVDETDSVGEEQMCLDLRE